MQNIKYKKAFSLIELSIVGLIISILISGILGSQIMTQKSRIANAQSLTSSSPVASMGGLVAWYETTLKKSFNKSEAKDGNAISAWYDLNPEITTVRNNATQSTGANQPIYREKAINSLPVVEFTRSNSHFLEFDGTNLENNEFTLFFVEQRTSSDTHNYFLAGSDATLNTNLIVGYNDDTTITIAYAWNGMKNKLLPTDPPTSPIPGYSSPKAHIYSVSFNFVNRKLYDNGTEIEMEHFGLGTEQDATTEYNTAYIGNHINTYYYQGNLGEVILFNKYLKTDERKEVEHYLGKKWGITVN